MSLNKSRKLKQVARLRCRELRKKSTNAEKLFWEQVRNKKFIGLKINRQFPIFYDILGKETFYIADFYCNEKKLIIELDGAVHNYQIEKDMQRTEILKTLGIKVIRFKNNEVEQSCDSVLKRLKIIASPR